MLSVLRGSERGHLNHGWLDTYHSFSFGDYYDPRRMGYRSLRVINEDRVDPGQGFGMHGHRDMEIVTVVLSGRLQHRDSLGNGGVLPPGELQRMSAGRGIRHSEFNPSATEPVHLYQIWLLPDTEGIEPEYEQRRFDAADRTNRLLLAASGDGRQGSMRIHQNADILLSTLSAGSTVEHPLRAGRGLWLQVARGSVRVGAVGASGSASNDDANSATLAAGDAAIVEEAEALRIAATAEGEAELILFDLA
ncbi:MAG: pirin family protein [Planctomycetaceae bacterium]|nr:pirin family protein [Planctomycetaceae bacterium]